MSKNTPEPPVVIRHLGQQDYHTVWRAMQAFNLQRNEDTPDELWLLQHPPVYTLGLNGKREHILQHTDIPVVEIDRGGQVTYHGPGQWVVYTLIDLQRKNIGVRQLVDYIEQSIIELLSDYGIRSEQRAKAPGVYVEGAKIAALGLRVRRGCSYHGLALNVEMDLEPFAAINPCGYAGLPVTQLSDLLATSSPDMDDVGQQLIGHLCKQLGYNQRLSMDGLDALQKERTHD